MHIDYTAWDDPYIEAPDLPTELELLEDEYPDIASTDYATRDDLHAALWAGYVDDLRAMYERHGSDVSLNPYADAERAIDRAADVLWSVRSHEEG